MLFPLFLYPGQAIMMSASIFMTVAIAMERYVAVHYPVDYNQVQYNHTNQGPVVNTNAVFRNL
jgi:hypothetical protein